MKHTRPPSMLQALRRFLDALPAKLKEEDKGKHMVWSFWLTMLALLMLPTPAALAMVLLIGLAKECWDFRYGSGFCWYDMLGNALGVLAAVIFISLAPEGLYQT